MPEQSLLQCLRIYAFSDKYLITTLKQHSRGRFKRLFMQIRQKSGVVIVLEFVFHWIYSDIRFCSLKCLAVKFLREFGISERSRFNTSISGLEKSAIWDDLSIERSQYNYVFDRSKKPQIQPRSRTWYQDEFSVLAAVLHPYSASEPSLLAMRRLIQAKEFETADKFAGSFWGVTFPKLKGDADSTLMSLGDPLLCKSVTDVICSSDKDLSDAIIYITLLRLMPKLAEALGIPHPNVYRDSQDFLVRASQDEILAVVKTNGSSGATYLQGLVKDDLQCKSPMNPLRVRYCDDEAKLMGFARGAQVASEHELSDLSSVCPSKKIEKLHEICVRPVERVKESLRNEWVKMYSFFRTIASIFVCSGSSCALLSKVRPTLLKILSLIVEFCKTQSKPLFKWAHEDEVVFADSLREKHEYDSLKCPKLLPNEGYLIRESGYL